MQRQSTEWISPRDPIRPLYKHETVVNAPTSTTIDPCCRVSQYSGLGIVIIIIVMLVVIALIALLIFYLTRRDNPPLDIPITTPNSGELPLLERMNDTTGASMDGSFNSNNGSAYQDSVSCNKGPTRMWVTGPDNSSPACTCVAPFYGQHCMHETYSDAYYAVGNINDDTLTTSVISTMDVDRLSFAHQNPKFDSDNQTTCTGLCDDDSACIGVIYKQAPAPDLGVGNDDKSSCTLLRSLLVNDGKNITYDPNAQADLYLKHGEQVKFKDRVFLYEGTLPLRYWLSDRNESTQGSSWALYHKVLYQLPFRPTNVINNTGSGNGDPWVGVIANKPIPVSDLKSIISQGTTSEYIVVSPTTTELNLPSGWINPYAIFVSESDENGASPPTDCKSPGQRAFKWNEGFSDESGKKITISPGTSVLFVSDDGYIHDMHETTCNWSPITKIKDRTTEFSLALTFKSTTYLRCNCHPSTMRLKVDVQKGSSEEVVVEWNIDNKQQSTTHEISLGDEIRFISCDDMFHGIVSKNSPELIRTKICRPLNHIVRPKKKGTYNFCCRVYGQRLTARVVVS